MLETKGKEKKKKEKKNFNFQKKKAKVFLKQFNSSWPKPNFNNEKKFLILFG